MSLSYSEVPKQPPSTQRITLLRSLLFGWYRIAAPNEVPFDASLNMRELVRRGRLASIILLGILIGTFLAIPAAVFAAPDMFNLPIATGSVALGMICCLLTIPFNRSGRLTLVGILLLVAVNITLSGIILSLKAGLDPIFLSLYDLLAATELIAVAVFRPVSVFLIASLNTALVFLDVALQPKAMMWGMMIMSPQMYFAVLARPVVVYFIVALVAYLLTRSSQNAIRRADRAEAIATMEHAIAQQRRQLEYGVDQILQTHYRVMQGDLNARAPVQPDSQLWQISVSLNNFLARYQNSLQAERILQLTAKQVTELRQAISASQTGHQVYVPAPQGTPVDAIIGDIYNFIAKSPR